VIYRTLVVMSFSACAFVPQSGYSQDTQRRNCSEAIEEHGTVISMRDWEAVLRTSEKANRLCKFSDTEADRQERANSRLPALYNLGRIDEALKEANQCIVNNSALPVCYYWKAAMLLELGRPKEAQAVKSQGLRLCEIQIKRYEESELASREPSTPEEYRSQTTYEVAKVVLENFQRLDL